MNGVGFLESGFEAPLEITLSCFKFICRDVATTHEGFGVEGAHAALGFDQVIHQRLSHRRVIAFIVTASAVTDQVDDNVGFELLAVGESYFCDAEHRFRVIAVDMENGRLNGFCHIGGIDRSSSIVRECGETNLVVDDDVHRSAGLIGTKLGHLKCF